MLTSSPTSDTPLPQQCNESSNLSSLLLLSDSSMITTHGAKASPPAVPLPTLSNNATLTKSVSVVEVPASSENPTSHSKHASKSSISPEAILDISIAMWDAGWADIKAMIDEDPKVMEWDAFPKVFHLKYVKSLVCKYKKLWGNTPEPPKKKFITLGNTSNGSWCKFQEALRDPTMVGPLICDNVVSTVPQ